MMAETRRDPSYLFVFPLADEDIDEGRDEATIAYRNPLSIMISKRECQVV
jgi:hypothetical protein